MAENFKGNIEKQKEVDKNMVSNQTPNLKCGIIMPIAAMDSYTEKHWQDVKKIIIEASQQVDGLLFETSMVSDSKETNVIHRNIIQNVYNSDIVICDISGRNPNVLFELGMRLTFDKPTIVIKDIPTPFMFDTGNIQTLEYPKDLRYDQIVEFKEELAIKIKQTYEASINIDGYSPFLGNFGRFLVPKLNQEEVSDPQKIILDRLDSLQSELKSITTTQKKSKNIENGTNFADILDQELRHSSSTYNLHRIIRDYLRQTDDKSRTAEEIILDPFFNSYMRNRLGAELDEISPGFLADVINTTRYSLLTKK
ncbi:hypothetical protein [Peribacillus sp. NPDC056705]|uniref:hypothetical protein n=1 Tax=Peribacillus sp. NPDC056705 TaxID=3345918 RepID=UPI00374A21D9